MTADKAAFRTRAFAARGNAIPVWGTRLAGHALNANLIRPGDIVAGFSPMRGEIDITPLLLALLGRGHRVLLPETPPRGQPLVFRSWRPGIPLIPGRYGTLHPDTAPEIPTFLLVPLLAFDAAGHRLGYGGGYYDRTIEALPGIRTLGCAFAVQQVDAVPVLPHDARLDAIATERGVILPEF